jgi:hypothetical protein
MEMEAFACVRRSKDRRTAVALTSTVIAIFCVFVYLQLAFIASSVNSNVSEAAKLQFTTLPDQLPFEIQRLKEEASASQASEIEKTRQEVEQAVTTKMEKKLEEHLVDLREKHKGEMEQLRTDLSKQMNDANSKKASASQASEIEKTRQEVEQAVTTKMEKKLEEHLVDLREKHKGEMEQLRTELSKQMNGASSNTYKTETETDDKSGMVDSDNKTNNTNPQAVGYTAGPVIYPHKGKATSINLIGERHSGTNWITDHLVECFGDQIPVR